MWDTHNNTNEHGLMKDHEHGDSNQVDDEKTKVKSLGMVC